jgi:hypothetical protein
VGVAPSTRRVNRSENQTAKSANATRAAKMAAEIDVVQTASKGRVRRDRSRGRYRSHLAAHTEGKHRDIQNRMLPLLQPVPATKQVTLERMLTGLTWIGRFDYDLCKINN